eukprot:g5735.t1
MPSKVFTQCDPVYLALSKLRRRHYDECIDICSEILERTPLDQAVWYIKCRALTLKDYIDDTEMEEEGIGDLLMDENSVNSVPRPGTSLNHTNNGVGGTFNGIDKSLRPMSASGRPLTGYARPGTASRGGDGGSMSMTEALKGSRPGTSRAVTSLGRQVRLGTASLKSNGGTFIDVDKLNLRNFSRRGALSKVLVDYLLYHENNPRKALELAAAASERSDFKDWWWKARLGKSYYRLGLNRDAEQQFKSAQREQPMVITALELAKVYLKADQPNAAMRIYSDAAKAHPGETSLLIAKARVLDLLLQSNAAVSLYRRVLHHDATSVEAISCLASHHFYSNQPAVALRYYRRLVQMGVNTTELWNNLGLCCFYSSQYDMTLSCFERALKIADDDNMADVWYNIGQVAIGIGDLGLAYQGFKIAISIDNNHIESYNNLGVLEVSCDARNARIARQEFSCDQECSLAFGKYVGLSKESLPFAVQESMATEPVTGNRTDQISIESKKIDEAQRHLREQAAKAEATARLRAQKIEKESKEKIKAAEVAAEKAKAAKMAAEKAKAEKKARIAAAAKAAANAKAKAAQQAANEAARAAKAAAAAAAAAAAEESPPPPPPPPRQTE